MAMAESLKILYSDAEDKILKGKSDGVLNTLVDRHVQLASLYQLYCPDRQASLFEPSDSQESATRSIDLRSIEYKLAATDLSVETALGHLDMKARKYQWLGRATYGTSLLVMAIGVSVSFLQLGIVHLSVGLSWLEIREAPLTENWSALVTAFSRAFTFYGLIVLSSVALWRVGRALLDQSERLFDRRHALRQGRLFVHLAEGRVPIEAMEKAFSWNIAQENAFENLVTDAKAPWGAVMAELIKTAPALVKAGTEAANRDKKD